MKVKVISDGTPGGTQVLDGETGQQIHRIQSLWFNIDVDEPMADLSLTLKPFELSAEATVGRIRIGKTWYYPKLTGEETKDGEVIITELNPLEEVTLDSPED